MNAVLESQLLEDDSENKPQRTLSNAESRPPCSPHSSQPKPGCLGAPIVCPRDEWFRFLRNQAFRMALCGNSGACHGFLLDALAGCEIWVAGAGSDARVHRCRRPNACPGHWG